MYNDAVLQMSLGQLADGDADAVPTQIEMLSVNAMVTPRSLALLTLGGITSSLSHM